MYGNNQASHSCVVMKKWLKNFVSNKINITKKKRTNKFVFQRVRKK